MYEKFKKEDLILRDALALDRTVLANKRTLFAYIRTAIMFFVSSATIFKFFPEEIFLFCLAFLLGVIGILIFIYGIFDYFKLAKKLTKFN